MIDRKALLGDLKKLVTKLEKDLRERWSENAEVDARVRIEYEKAKEAKRTAQAYKVWRDEWITQVAVAWVLGVVFVRFIEDNGLIAAPFIAGPGERLQFAKEQRTAFFQQNPTQSDREYLEHVFGEVAKLPAMKELYDERHNPLWALGVSGDGAKLILEQFQKIDPGTGTLVHDFADSEWNTRFLGDLYQDLSEAARKKYALLQTPEFVEEFILDRTLDPAIAEFGLETVRMIDPTCGSGHFLLGGFARLFRLWEEREPATVRNVLAQRALDTVYGVDLNPYATAISRFRLLLAAMRAGGVKRLIDAPDFRINLATGDSLLHGPRFSATAGVQATLDPTDDPLRHVYATEDREQLRRILGQQYHAVVGNPPYITVKDKALNEAYRQKYGSCAGTYSLAVPFMERFFELAFRADGAKSAGFIGKITANTFMKREFGRRLVERYFAGWELSSVIDSAGAYIPGHGTPTLILFGRNRAAVGERVRAVMGIKGEPGTPLNPANGLVWKSIVELVDHSDEPSEFVSVVDVPRSQFSIHPWSMGGGGAAELKVALDLSADQLLGDVVTSIGFASFSAADDAFVAPLPAFLRKGVERSILFEYVNGEAVRDWTFRTPYAALVPLDTEQEPLRPDPEAGWYRWLWPYKSAIENTVSFNQKTRKQLGEKWWTWYRWVKAKYAVKKSIVFTNVATHNHFVLDRGGHVFNAHAPVIKMPSDATDDAHFRLLGVLNSSVACFWMKQVFHNKGAGGGTRVASGHSPLGDETWESHYEFGGTGLLKLPLPSGTKGHIARAADEAAIEYTRLSPDSLVNEISELENLASASGRAASVRKRMIALQEELDWATYNSFGLSGEAVAPTDTHIPDIDSGERAFAISLARDCEVGKTSTKWFEKNGVERCTEIPAHWPAEYRLIVEKRIGLIRDNESIRLLEKPEYKRRWRIERRDRDVDRAAREWLLQRLEGDLLWNGNVSSIARLAIRAASDVKFMRAAGAYRGTGYFDVAGLIADLLTGDTVPLLPIDRYRDSGLRNRAAWEETWDLQRREDGGEKIGEMPVPPKYKSSDFKSQTYWSLRGKLDVPKERFISFPGSERETDPSLPILWAGYDHLQQARAVAAYFQDLKENEAAAPPKLGKLLACILELLPWLKQWHNEIDPEYGTRMGDFFESFMHAEMAGLGLTMDDMRRIRGL